MKKMIGRMATGCAVVLMAASTVFSADATLNMDVNSAYVCRGVTYNDGLVLQPSLDVLKGGFDVNIWGNLDIDDYDGILDSGEFSELDLTMTYSRSFDKLSLTGGVIGYVYSAGGGDKTTAELYGNASYALADKITLGLAVYYDVDEFKDTCYSMASLAYTQPVGDKVSVTAGAAAGYMARASKYGESGFNEYKLSLKASYALTDTLGLGANINYTDAIDDDVLVTDVNTFGGVSVSCKF